MPMPSMVLLWPKPPPGRLCLKIQCRPTVSAGSTFSVSTNCATGMFPKRRAASTCTAAPSSAFSPSARRDSEQRTSPPEEILFHRTWIGNAVKPERGRSGETQHDRFSPCGRKQPVRRVAHHLRSPSVANHQAGLARHDLGRHVRWYCKIQPVAKPFILGPFVVGPEIGETRFDFDDPDFSARSNGHHIDPPP